MLVTFEVQTQVTSLSLSILAFRVSLSTTSYVFPLTSSVYPTSALGHLIVTPLSAKNILDVLEHKDSRVTSVLARTFVSISPDSV